MEVVQAEKKRRLDTVANTGNFVNLKKNVVEHNGKSCLHEVAWPPDQRDENSLLPPGPRKDKHPAREYPFQIDPFQQTAINCMEAGHSVLVAAHTSAGKTVVAEYAFAMALRDGARVVYTSPLKALSNQKYREFQEKFGDVGLITGDVVINPSSTCLVMTTEILRSMLYRGSEVVREVSLIIYDEIHYLRDKERGVVWEESIILAPRSARFAFLSATIPNARDFAEWIADTHDSPCHVVYTDYRPTPLQHFIFPAGADGIFLVVDEKNNFREDSFGKAIAALNDEQETRTKKKDQNGVNKEPSDVFKLISMVIERNLDPIIIFSFSKNECEALAEQLGGMEINSSEEKEMVHAIYDSAIEVLSESDRRLPEVVSIIKRIERGIGVHHSGMLPILKELTEILFQEGLIKVLFATETFSTGLNMPAKTVVFTHARKFDGGAFRWISSGEYTQMSGRAGRRGLDDKGTVILMIDSKLDPAIAKDMLRGTPDPLFSEFHLTYPMLINMTRVEGARPEDLIRRSYRQFQSEKAIPELKAKLATLQAQLDDIIIDDEVNVESYAGLVEQQNKLRTASRHLLMNPKFVVPFLQPGRLLQVISGDVSADIKKEDNNVDETMRAWVAVVNFELLGKKTADDLGGGNSKGKSRRVVIDILATCAESKGARLPEIVSEDDPETKRATYVISIDLERVLAISTLRVHLPKDLRTREARDLGAKVLREVRKRFPDKGPPLLDPEKDIKVTSEEYYETIKRLDKLENMLKTHPLQDDPSLSTRLQAFTKKQDIRQQIRIIEKGIRNAAGLVLQDDLKSRMRVLGRLGYIHSHGIVSTKGKAAAEISTGDELVMCELLFSGAFGSLGPDEIAALVSCFIWRDKSDVRARVPHQMEGPYSLLRDAARRVAKSELECKLALDLEDYVDSFKADLMPIVIEWCHGATFAHISALAGDKTHAGSLVRAIRRLEELLRQVSGALKVIGDNVLAEKFDAANEKIKRDIIFAASLFL
eukprot:jgi/Picsp_1/793/NSC_04282-R1_superkiller viralicidic activity 2-like 2